MAFDPGPQELKVLRKDMHRLHCLIEALRVKTYRGPELAEMDKIVRRILRLDDKQYNTED